MKRKDKMDNLINATFKGSKCKIYEILEDNAVKSWYIPDLPDEYSELRYIPVGDMFVAWVNSQIDFSEQCFAKSKEELQNSILNSDMDKAADISILRHNALKGWERLLSDIENQDYVKLAEDYQDLSKYLTDTYKEESYIQIVPFGANGKIGNKYILSGPIQYGFVMMDLYHLITTQNRTLRICSCGHVFAPKHLNQKYCDKCIDTDVPQKNAKDTNEVCKLRSKIYKRLSDRDKYGNTREYGLPFNDHIAFSVCAKAYKAEHTREDFYSWLKEIEVKTK